jgi:hypothetical protein
MEPLGPATDPTPYITAAYVIGALLIGGFATWTFVQRLSLKRLLGALVPASRPTGPKT